MEAAKLLKSHNSKDALIIYVFKTTPKSVTYQLVLTSKSL